MLVEEASVRTLPMFQKSEDGGKCNVAAVVTLVIYIIMHFLVALLKVYQQGLAVKAHTGQEKFCPTVANGEAFGLVIIALSHQQLPLLEAVHPRQVPFPGPKGTVYCFL